MAKEWILNTEVIDEIIEEININSINGDVNERHNT